MTEVDDDALLTALIDGELGGDRRAAIQARLASEPALRARLTRLRAGGRPFEAAFRDLLSAAPIERLSAALPPPGVSVRRKPRTRLPGVAMVAALAIFCVGLGASLSWLWPRGETETWRRAVAEYVELYTADTFAGQPAPSSLDPLSAKLGIELTPTRIALNGLQFKSAQTFSYDGAPLGQIAYLDPASGPVLFCVIVDGERAADLNLGEHGRYATASWADGGRGYMLIGALPRAQIAELAELLRRRF